MSPNRILNSNSGGDAIMERGDTLGQAQAVGEFRAMIGLCPQAPLPARTTQLSAAFLPKQSPLVVHVVFWQPKAQACLQLGQGHKRRG